MAKIILSINAGSSSVKVSVFSYNDSPTSNPKQLALIQVTGLTAPPAKLQYDRGDHHIKNQDLPTIKSAQEAYHYILNHLISDPDLPQLTHPSSIAFACHRVVHGGPYSKPTRIDSDTYHHLQNLSDLAPLHNAGALEIVRAVHTLSPGTTNLAFFDSAFHHNLPAAVSTYAINQTIASKNQLRKYGFHGLSYAFITRTCAAHLSKPPSQTNLIALHLGSGCSACCIQRGASLDTSMGLTPLAGLPGATRSGDVDPSLIFHFTSEAGKLSAAGTGKVHLTQAEQILNQQSGWGALTGTTDFGVISEKAAEPGDDGEGDGKFKLAFDLLVDRIVGFVGAYYVTLGGEVDALVFAGGIGEKGARLRAAVVQGVRCLGFELDGVANRELGGDGEDEVVVEIGAKGSRHRILVCRTDEQGEMARQCVREVESWGEQ